RSITQINPQQFELDIIESTSDFTRYSPAVNQATGTLGNFGSPTLRGALGDSFQNEIRLLNRQSNNRPFTLNAYEGSDIVAGPAPVIFGPSARTAGYANFLTKKPYFDRERTAVTLRLGKWYSDDAGYKQNLNWQIDTGGPLIPGKLAYRLSYQGENVNAYYRDAGDKWHDLYGTLAWLPRENLTVDWNFEAGTFDYENYGGLNRVTQDLIDHGTYLAGPATPILRGTFSPTGFYSPVYVPGAGFNGTQFIARTKVGTRYLPGAALSGAPTQAQAGAITGYVFDPALVQSRAIDGQTGYTSKRANTWTDAFNTQLRVKRVVSDDFTVVNNTVYQYYQTNNYGGKESVNYIEATVFENRTELRLSREFSLLGSRIKHDSNFGLSLRNDYVLNYKDTDAANTGSTGDWYDITDPSTFGRNAFFGANLYPLYTNTVLTRFGWLNGFNLVLPIPEEPKHATTPGGSGRTGTGTTATGLSAATNETSVDSVGLYSQHSFKLGDRWIADLGARGTAVWANLRNPLPATADTDVRDNTAHLLPSGSG
ncbi:MAG: Plug domain-containing protein, partial [Verrucomicrobia bacterium]|nr:Plug domain-containing protein [Verrucomicrobiota bacterium]